MDDIDISNKDSQSDSNNSQIEKMLDRPFSEDSKIEEQRKTTMDDLTICLFSNHKSKSIKENLDYMRIKHGFYVLDIDCLISIKALLYYLAEKIQVGHLSIYDNRKFRSAQAAQNHMVDTCHCCMNSEYFDEYEYFYDFSATYEDNFKGKTLDDFDLTEEPLAKPMSVEVNKFIEQEEKDAEMEVDKVEVKPKMEQIPEVQGNDDVEDGDDDWEDIGEEEGDSCKHIFS